MTKRRGKTTKKAKKKTTAKATRKAAPKRAAKAGKASTAAGAAMGPSRPKATDLPTTGGPADVQGHLLALGQRRLFEK
jgi:hypothetical protein